MPTSFETIPGVGAPCRRALTEAGYQYLEALDGVSYQKLIALHGVGARGLERIHAALQEQGMTLTGDIPEPKPLGHKVTWGHTGEVAKDIKTTVTDIDPETYIQQLPWPRRVTHGKQLLEIFNRVTGDQPVMWGPSMIGYGQIHYESTSGRHGDWFLVGFSPRQAKISLYGLTDFPDLLQKLGKHSAGKGCIYVNKLEDIDLDVLEQLITSAWTRQLN